MESGGDIHVRDARKALAKEIQTCLDEMDRKKEQAWQKWKSHQQQQQHETAEPKVVSDVDEPTNINVEPEVVVPPSTSASTPKKNPIVPPISIIVVDDKGLASPAEVTEPTQAERDFTTETATWYPPEVHSADAGYLANLSQEPSVEESQSIISPPVLNPTTSSSDALGEKHEVTNMDTEDDSEESSVEGIVHISITEDDEPSGEGVRKVETSSTEPTNSDFVMVEVSSPFDFF